MTMGEASRKNEEARIKLSWSFTGFLLVEVLGFLKLNHSCYLFTNWISHFNVCNLTQLRVCLLPFGTV